MWKILHSMWTMLLQLERSVLQLTLCRSYCTAGIQLYCSSNGAFWSEHHEEITSQHVDSVFAAGMECVTVNILWKILHSRWTVVLHLEWRLNGVCYSEHYVGDTAQQVDNVIAA